MRVSVSAVFLALLVFFGHQSPMRAAAPALPSLTFPAWASSAGRLALYVYAGIIVREVAGTVANRLVRYTDDNAEGPLSKEEINKIRVFSSMFQAVVRAYLSQYLKVHGVAGESNILASFDVGLKFSLLVEFLSATTEVMHDMYEIVSVLASEFLRPTQPGRVTSDLAYPLSGYGTRTVLDCGTQNPYCLSAHEEYPFDIFSKLGISKQVIRETTRLMLEAGGISVGAILAILSLRVGAVVTYLIHKTPLKDALGEFRADVFETTLTKYIDTTMLDSIREYLMGHMSSQLASFVPPAEMGSITFKDVHEAVQLGEHGQRLTAEEIYKLKAPLAKFITKLLFGDRAP